MDQDLLVGDRLTEQLIAAGGHLIASLDKLNVLLTAALWLYMPDEKTWRLVLASPEVRKSGPKALYRKVRTAASRLPPESQIGTKDVTVLDDKAPLITLLRQIPFRVPAIGRIRFSKNVINGQLIDDALIYRLV